MSDICQSEGKIGGDATFCPSHLTPRFTSSQVECRRSQSDSYPGEFPKCNTCTQGSSRAAVAARLNQELIQMQCEFSRGSELDFWRNKNN